MINILRTACIRSLTLLREEYRLLLQKPSYLLSLALSCVLLYVAYILNYYAGIYATLNADRWVRDIILSNTPLFDTRYIHALGAGALRTLVLLIVVVQPRRVPFLFKSLALLILVRCVFINLTNLGTFPGALPIHSTITFGGDLYFSGHVAIPFLLALIFWDKAILRYGFFLISILFAGSVLLGHLHYSIDVFSAPFFAYGVFAASRRLFVKDFQRTQI